MEVTQWIQFVGLILDIIGVTIIFFNFPDNSHANTVSIMSKYNLGSPDYSVKNKKMDTAEEGRWFCEK